MFLKGFWSFLRGMLFIYLQVLLMPFFGIWGVRPLILLPWLIFMVWNREEIIALPVAFIVGLMYDTLNPSTFGMHAFSFVLLAILIDILRIPFEHDSLVAKGIAILSCNLVFGIFSFLGMGLSWGFEPSLYQLSLIAFLYNILFSALVFALMQIASRLRLSVAHD